MAIQWQMQVVRWEHQLDEVVPDASGWYAIIYEGPSQNVEAWLTTNMKSEYEYEMNFNSGCPIETLFIKDEKDAMLFRLTFSDFFV